MHPLQKTVGLLLASAALAAGAQDTPLPSEGNPAGAKRLWAFSRPSPPPLPPVRHAAWPRSPIDYFVLSKLEASGLQPAPAAEKRTLIRRVSFDLTGLPPTPREVDAFLADRSPSAYLKLVDRLLASPRYGERWGRHWLDLARYADSNGMDENLAYVNAFRYRDYVIAAMNADKPYDQFITEQIAGDLLPVPGDPLTTIERQIATGFLSVGPKMLAEDDPVKKQMDIVDEQIDTIGKTFLGMTFGCARCHDHKFDPITSADYYGLAGIFKSTKTMETLDVVARWFERPLRFPEIEAKRRVWKSKIASKKEAIRRQVGLTQDRLLAGSLRRIADYLVAASEWRRQPGPIDPLLATEDTETIAGLQEIEAERFTRGNAERQTTGPGEGIGIVSSRGAGHIEFDVQANAPGPHRFEWRYAAARSRPVRLLINGRLVHDRAAARRTGGGDPQHQAWDFAGVFLLDRGKNVLRIESDQALPHLDKLAFWPVPGEGPVPSRTLVQIARKHRLSLAFLRRWTDYLEATRTDSETVFTLWHAFETDSDADLEIAARSSPELARMLLTGLPAGRDDARRELARRYQGLLDRGRNTDREPLRRETPRAVLSDRLRARVRTVWNASNGPFQVPEDLAWDYPAEVRSTLARLREQAHALTESMPRFPTAMGVTEGKIEDLKVHLRGNYLTLGKLAPRGIPQVFGYRPSPPIGREQSGRLAVARWIASPRNPLTSRVIVNRVWRWHFGRGIVPTPDNFGRTGTPPTHPALLDWLADWFVGNGESLKALHRMILLSSTYQMSCAYDAKAYALDPRNSLLWRMNRRRLDAESIRDALLAASGRLDTRMGGTLLKAKARQYVTSTTSSITTEYRAARRSVYLPVIRSALYEMFQVFDFPDPSVPNGNRATTTIAPQALFLMNSGLVREQSLALAQKALEQDRLSDGERLRWLYRRLYARPPSSKEIAKELAFLEAYSARLKARGETEAKARVESWQGMCRSLLSVNEFVYLN